LPATRDVCALDGVEFRRHEGELLVLLGPSGSGKSTLLNILGGLDVPTSGRVLFEGQDVTAADEDALTDFRRRHVGFVFQFYNLEPGALVAVHPGDRVRDGARVEAQ
jgi:putative ABC transport system ATP-binding protein